MCVNQFIVTFNIVSEPTYSRYGAGMSYRKNRAPPPRHLLQSSMHKPTIFPRSNLWMPSTEQGSTKYHFWVFGKTYPILYQIAKMPSTVLVWAGLELNPNQASAHPLDHRMYRLSSEIEPAYILKTYPLPWLSTCCCLITVSVRASHFSVHTVQKLFSCSRVDQSSVAEWLGRWANLGVITTTELLGGRGFESHSRHE